MQKKNSLHIHFNSSEAPVTQGRICCIARTACSKRTAIASLSTLLETDTF